MMDLKSPSLDVFPCSRVNSQVDESLPPRRAGLMSAALRRAADDAGAAISHQLSEPLTAMLLYLHDLSERCALVEADPVALRGAVERALRATERTCEILEDLGHHVMPPIDLVAAVARGSEAIDLWKRKSRTVGGPVRAAHISTHPLTVREREVLTLVAEGASNKSGAQRLGISSRTFETHRAHIMRKLGARNTADLLRIALNGAI